MKIQDQDFYHGVVLKQIADHPTLTSINKVSAKDGVYQINDVIRILVKYSSAEEDVWKFTFRENDFDELYDYEYFIVLVCGGDTICLLSSEDVDEVIDMSGNKTQWIGVTYPEGGQMRVNGSQGELSHAIAHNAFPKNLFDIVTKENEEFAWPPLSKITFYLESPQSIVSYEDRLLDLSDTLMSAYSERIVYFGLSSKSYLWEAWTEENLEKIEAHIRYDLEFDGYSVEIERITDVMCPYTKKQDIPCHSEFVWKLHIFSEDSDEEWDVEQNDINNSKETELNGREVQSEIRNVSGDFPKLVRARGREVCSIEIDVDYLKQEEKYRLGGWEDLILEITAKWVEENSYSDVGTVWAWGGYSVNFTHQSYSMFYAVLGLPKEFREFLSNQLDYQLGEYVRTYSDYVVPNRKDGWDARCHIQDGKVWRILDAASWKEYKA